MEELNRGETKIKLNVSLHETIIQMISDAIPEIEARLAEEAVGEEKRLLGEIERFFAAWDEKSDEKIVAVLNNLPLENIKALVLAGNQIIENLYNEAEKEYNDWVLKGKSAIEQAAKQFLKPGEEIRLLEEFIGKIPDDFVGGGSFESSSVYRKWIPRIEEVKRRFENVKIVLRAKIGLPNIPVEQEVSASLSSRREAIPEDVKMKVWKRDGGKCVKCVSQQRLEYDHIIPLSKGGQ